MFDTREQIRSQFRAGEDGRAEFKEIRFGDRLLIGFLSRLRSKRTGQVFLESRGEGVRKILEDDEVHSGRRPEYELFGDELRLTLWAKRVPPAIG